MYGNISLKFHTFALYISTFALCASIITHFCQYHKAKPAKISSVAVNKTTVLLPGFSLSVYFTLLCRLDTQTNTPLHKGLPSHREHKVAIGAGVCNKLYPTLIN